MVHYPPATWAVLREIYECTPARTSIEGIRQKAMELLGTTELPTRGTISSKLKRQAWQKIAGKQCQLDSKQLADTVANICANIDSLEQKNSSALTVNKAIQLDKMSENLGLFDKRTFMERKTAQVILEHRQRSYKTGLLFDTMANSMEQALGQMLDFANYYADNLDEFGDMDMEQAYAMTFKKYDKIIDGIRAVESLAGSTTALAKLDFVLYGLNPEDVREPESDKRLINLMADEDYYAKEQELLRLEGAKIAERMQAISSGQFEAEVKQQAMQSAQGDMVYDDTEFVEIL